MYDGASLVSSFPYELWAREIGEVLGRYGIEVSIVEAGPRAYQVYVPDEEVDRAGEVLNELGYLTCAVGGGTLSGCGRCRRTRR